MVSTIAFVIIGGLVVTIFVLILLLARANRQILEDAMLKQQLLATQQEKQILASELYKRDKTFNRDFRRNKPWQGARPNGGD